MSLRSLALSSFKTEPFEVKEWNATVFVREPSILDFHAYLNAITAHKDDPEKVVEAEIKLLIAVLLDEDKNPVFTADDKAELLKSYNLTHRKILNKVFDLISNDEDPVSTAKKK